MDDSECGGEKVPQSESDGEREAISSEDGGAFSAPDLNRSEPPNSESGGNVIEQEEPFEGQEFESEAAAVEFYFGYAQRAGFAIRLAYVTRSRDGFVASRTMVCNKEGYKRTNRHSKQSSSSSRPTSTTKNRVNAVTRVGCKAKVGFRRLKSGKWAIKTLVKEHNHPLSVTQSQDERSQSTRVYEVPADDSRIRQLTEELMAERKRSASLRQFVEVLLNHIEEHSQGVSKRVQCMVEKVDKIDSQGNSKS